MKRVKTVNFQSRHKGTDWPFLLRGQNKKEKTKWVHLSSVLERREYEELIFREDKTVK